MIRVVKVGGSLLDWPRLPEVLNDWLLDQSPAFNVLLPGGGSLAAAIRQADRNFSLGDEAAHWLCIDALSLSARIVAAVVPSARLLATHADLMAALAADSSALSANIVLDPRDFLRNHEQHLPGSPLPHDWNVTSDSIAARLAETLVADELVLLKSCDPPAPSLAELAQAGYVDSHFASLNLGRLMPQFVNLRRWVSVPQRSLPGPSAVAAS